MAHNPKKPGSDDNEFSAQPQSSPSERFPEAQTRGETDKVQAAARAVLAALAGSREPSPADLALVTRQLRRHIERLFPGVEAEDVIQSTLARFMSRPHQLAEREIENAWGYLLGSTRNAAIDAIRARARRREVEIDSLPEPSAPEDAIGALIDRAASHNVVVAALRAHVRTGDELTTSVVIAWLDLAQELGRAPSTREVAPRAGVSHTTVAQTLKRFGDSLVEQQ